MTDLNRDNYKFSGAYNRNFFIKSVIKKKRFSLKTKCLISGMILFHGRESSISQIYRSSM